MQYFLYIVIYCYLPDINFHTLFFNSVDYTDYSILDWFKLIFFYNCLDLKRKKNQF
jgi:hypothetical protein